MPAVAANIQALEEDDAPESQTKMVIQEEFVYIITITDNKLELFSKVWFGPAQGFLGKPVFFVNSKSTIKMSEFTYQLKLLGGPN